MSKFSGGSARMSMLDQLKQVATPELPSAPTGAEQAAAPQVEAPVEQTPTPAPGPQISRADVSNLSVPAGEIQTPGFDPLEQAMEEQRQAVPSIKQRHQQIQETGMAPRDRWDPVQGRQTFANVKEDGGMIARAQKMSKNAQAGQLIPSLRDKTLYEDLTADQVKVAEEVRQSKNDSLLAAMASVNAIAKDVDGKLAPDPSYMAVGSIITDKFLLDQSFGNPDEEAEVAFGALQGQSRDQVISELARKKQEDIKSKEPAKVSKASQNARLGNDIHLAYQRNKGVTNPQPLPKEEAVVLGDAFKEMWYESNPGMMTRAIGEDGQVYFQLTPDGVAALDKGKTIRDSMVAPKLIKPSHVPLRDSRLPGDTGRNVAKPISGKLGDPGYEKSIIQEAMNNLSQVPNVVDKQRAKILYATALPQLAQGPETFNQNNWQSKINNFGAGKYADMKAAAMKDGVSDAEATAVAENNMGMLRKKIANEIRSVAQNRNAPNFLSYSVQAYNGRIAPQQTYFNPTTSKAVRFVTRNVAPSIAKRGDRIDKNLRQMYAMMLVGDLHGLSQFKDPKNPNKFVKADALLPAAREHALRAAHPKLYKWGNELRQALAVFPDNVYEQISDAIDKGIALTDPNFPQIPQLDIKDPELVKAIADKGEDGPHFIDGLIDYANYDDAMNTKGSYPSYFNAYIDGKTNGLAANGMQMGDERVAFSTGSLRANDDILLDGNKDIRDDLQEIVQDDLTDYTFEEADPDGQLKRSAVARHVLGIRDLHKATTMTFGYGKDLTSFEGDVSDFIQKEVANYHIDPQSASPAHAEMVQAYESLTPAERNALPREIMGVYAPAIVKVMSKDALDSRALMRSSAMLHSLMDELMSIEGPSGAHINLGGKTSLGREGATPSEYSIKGPEGSTRIKTYQYENRESASAIRQRGDSMEPGGHAYGGSVPAPVQALDAMTVAATASGKSWKKLKAKSGNNPYLHTIYDAFKMDAMGFDTVLEDVNDNWLDASANWSYLQSTLDGTREGYQRMKERAKEHGLNTRLPSTATQYPNWLFDISENSSGMRGPWNLARQLKAVSPRPPEGTDPKEWNKMMNKRAIALHKKVGWKGDNSTWSDLVKTVGIMQEAIQFGQRMSSTIDKTNKKKAEVIKKIRDNGYKTDSGKTISLQYYAH